MRSFVVCAAALSLPLFAAPKNCCVETPPPPVDECVPFDADLFKKDEQVFSGHLQFLYWTVEQGCLDYALKMTHSAWGPSDSYAQGRMESGSFGWDPGFRIALSYFRAPRYWEVWGSYTRLTARGTDHAYKPEAATEFLTGTWPQIVPGDLASAKSRLHMNYNVFDLLIDRYFIPNPHLRLRMMGGAAAAWMDQDWHVGYTDTAGLETAIRNRWKYAGGGLKLGVMVDWFWTNDIYVTALAMTGAFMGSYSNHSRQTTNYQPTVADDTSVPVRDMHFSDTRPAFTAQAIFGPSWQKNYTCYRVEVFAGYEFNLWANLNEIYRSTSGGPSAAKETWINSSWTGLQGLTTRLTVDF